MTLHPRHTVGFRRWLEAIALIAVVVALPRPAHADLCSEYFAMTDREADQLASSLGGQGSMVRLLAQLERIDGCTILQHINRRLDMRFQEHRRLRAALLVVATIGRGATTDSEIVTAAWALATPLEFASERRALHTYIVEKLLAQPGGEPLLASVPGHIPAPDLRALAAGVSTTVPAAPWQPPGAQPGSFYVGNQAHKNIGAHYLYAHRNQDVFLNDTPISSILIALRRKGIGPTANRYAKAVGALALRPDIVNLDTLEIYEIKPAGAEAAAAARVAAYVAAFASAGVTVRPGRPAAPGTSGVVSAPAGHYRFYAPQPGVIAYQYRRGDFQPASAPATTRERDSSIERQSTTRTLLVTARPLRITRDLVDRYRDHMAATTGLSGVALLAYIVVSEGTRVFVIRNAIPAP